MTATEKVLQRKDASSLIVAIVLGFATLQFISTITSPLVAKILDENTQFQASGFKDQYLAPLLALVLTAVAVELLVWVVIGIRGFVTPKTSKKRK